MKVRTEASSNASLLKIIISALIAVVVSLVLIVIFALLIKWLGWEDNVIMPINIAIKTISVMIGTLVAVKNSLRAPRVGMMVGAIYVVVSFVTFSALLGSFVLSLNNLWDLLLGVAVGAIVGVFSNIIK